VVTKLSRTNEKIDPVLWTVQEVAEYLRVSEAKVYRLIKEQQLPVMRVGKTWRFRKDRLHEWLEQSAVTSLKKDGNSIGSEREGV
jgi:excisionase family DNA binding protein